MQWIEANFAWPRASLVAQMVKKLPAVQETQFQPLDQEDTLEMGMATRSSILAGEFHGFLHRIEEPGIAKSDSEHNWVTNTFTFTLHDQFRIIWAGPQLRNATQYLN